MWFHLSILNNLLIRPWFPLLLHSSSHLGDWLVVEGNIELSWWHSMSDIPASSIYWHTNRVSTTLHFQHDGFGILINKALIKHLHSCLVDKQFSIIVPEEGEQIVVSAEMKISRACECRILSVKIPQMPRTEIQQWKKISHQTWLQSLCFPIQ